MRYRAAMHDDEAGQPSDLFLAAGSPWLASNALAFVIADGGDRLLTTRRVVKGWQDVTADERVALFALIDQLGIRAGSLRFELAAADRWHMRVHGEDGAFAGLPGFSDGEGQQLLPALSQGLERAESADFLAAFLQPSGVTLLRPSLERALLRGVHVRVLTGDYLNITAPEALRALLELAAEFTTLKAAVYHCADGRSFHAKAYVFRAGAEAAAYVGSSNLSRMALTSGVEWNLRALARAQTGDLAAICAGFERLWTAAVPLTAAWIDDYATRPRPSKGWESPPPEPHAIQVEALAALRAAWADGAARGLVVLATGLGKTLLAAFAARAMGAQRVLFLAHRDEILRQGRRAFERVLPERSSGLFIGPRRDRGAELLFATVQTIGREEHLASFSRDHFDLVIIDEFHHAAAPSYRRLIEHFTPRFMLGLTATPERSDGAELLALCGDRLIHRAGLIEGIARKRLVPFTYRGIRDPIDYSAIPWRRGKFDPRQLDQALTRGDHAAQALSEYRRHAGDAPRRGLWFCASIAHAEFIAAYLTAHGVAAAAVHSQGGAPRSESLRRLAAGELQAIAAVDVFNEGVDVPDVDVVVLLRPTESRIVFLQQIGRGLRLPERSQKQALLILDFIGNHVSFLRKPQALMAFLGREVSREAAARMLRDRDFDLPDGCDIEYDTAALDVLLALGKEKAEDTLYYTFMQLQDRYGRRPLLGEMVAHGVQGRKPAALFGSWWDMLAELDALEQDEARVLAARRGELEALEAAKAPEAASWASLSSWAEHGGVGEAVPAAELGGESAAAALVAIWGQALKREGERVGLQIPVEADDQPVLEDMIKEVAAARMAEAARRGAASGDDAEIVLTVSHSSHNPIIRFKQGMTDFARRNVDVCIEGEMYTLVGTGVAFNTAQAHRGVKNPLPGLMRRMFGWRAGDPGTQHRVVFRRDDAGRWNLRPLYVEPATALPFYPELAVACGVGDVQHSGADEVRTLLVRAPVSVDPAVDFVVRARGASMDGGRMPIRDGDLVLCSHLDGASLVSVENEACLLIAHDGPDMSEAMIKVPVRDRHSGDWVLRSWSGEQVDLPVSRWSGLRVVARVRAVVQPVESSDN
jgi:superfamily II DNA or RNA helicase